MGIKNKYSTGKSVKSNYDRVGSTYILPYSKLQTRGLIFLLGFSSIFNSDELLDFKPEVRSKKLFKNIIVNEIRLNQLITTELNELSNDLRYLNISQLCLLSYYCYDNIKASTVNTKKSESDIITRRIQDVLCSKLASYLLNMNPVVEGKNKMASIGKKILDSIGVASGIYNQLNSKNITWLCQLNTEEGKFLKKVYEESIRQCNMLCSSYLYIYINFPELVVHCKDDVKIKSKNEDRDIFTHQIKWDNARAGLMHLDIIKFEKNTSNYTIDNYEFLNENLMNELKNAVAKTSEKRILAPLKDLKINNRENIHLEDSGKTIKAAKSLLKPATAIMKHTSKKHTPEWIKNKNIEV